MPTEIFLSHKSEDFEVARQIKQILGHVFPRTKIFLSEEITKGEDWLKEIRTTLERSKLFILLYFDPKVDWSFCFFEVGSYLAGRPTRSKKDTQRPLYCLHQPNFPPPIPLSVLQSTPSDPNNLERWLSNTQAALGRRRPLPKEKVKKAAIEIGSLINGRPVLIENPIKPYIWITPRRAEGQSDALSSLSLDGALVSADGDSAAMLRFQRDAVRNMDLLKFLQTLDCEPAKTADKRAYWIERFYASLRIAVDGLLELQEVAYFRHAEGYIYRPVVVSVSKSEDKKQLKLKVVFAHAVNQPTVDHPLPIQRLADGIRLGIRTRIEVFGGFAGRMSELYQEMLQTTSPTDEITKRSPVGRRLAEVLRAITEEGRLNGLRQDAVAPHLFFTERDQKEYESIRGDAIAIWDKILTQAEDDDKSGQFAKTENLIDDLKALNKRYLAIAVPQLAAMLAAEDDKCG